MATVARTRAKSATKKTVTSKKSKIAETPQVPSRSSTSQVLEPLESALVQQEAPEASQTRHAEAPDAGLVRANVAFLDNELIGRSKS
jgi:hypothetical protein